MDFTAAESRRNGMGDAAAATAADDDGPDAIPECTRDSWNFGLGVWVLLNFNHKKKSTKTKWFFTFDLVKSMTLFWYIWSNFSSVNYLDIGQGIDENLEYISKY